MYRTVNIFCLHLIIILFITLNIDTYADEKHKKDILLETEIKLIKKNLNCFKRNEKHLFYIGSHMGIVTLHNIPYNRRLLFNTHNHNNNLLSKDSFAPHINIGNYINNNIYIDLNYTDNSRLKYFNHLRNTKYNKKTQLSTLNFNINKITFTHSKTKSYIALGFGCSQINLSKMFREKNKIRLIYEDIGSISLSYILSLGIKYQLTSRCNINVGYNYQNYNKINEPKQYTIAVSKMYLSKGYKNSNTLKITDESIRIGLECLYCFNNTKLYPLFS